MSETNTGREGRCESFASLAHYTAVAEGLNMPEYWKPYAAQLANALFGRDYEAGDALLSMDGLTTREPMELLRELAGALAERGCAQHSLRLLRTEPELVTRRIRGAQSNICLPLIEEERVAYIGNQHGRILCVLGMEYWDKRSGESQVLWNHAENRAVEDPYELDVGTLSQLSDFCKVIAHGAVKSYTFFYMMHGFERERLQLLAVLQNKLRLQKPCSASELERLFSGHESFLASRCELDMLQFL